MQEPAPHCEVCENCRYYLMAQGFSAGAKNMKSANLFLALASALAGSATTLGIEWLFHLATRH